MVHSVTACYALRIVNFLYALTMWSATHPLQLMPFILFTASSLIV